MPKKFIFYVKKIGTDKFDPDFIIVLSDYSG